MTKPATRSRAKPVAVVDLPADDLAERDTRTGDLLADVAPAVAPADKSDPTHLIQLPPAERALIALASSATEKHLRALVVKTAEITNVVDANGREEAHRAGMTLKTARVTVEKTSKAAREDATAFSKSVIAEERRLIEITTAEEDRLFKLRDDFDAKVKAEKEEAERINTARIAAIKDRIAIISDKPRALAGATSAELESALSDLALVVITEADYQEFTAEATLALDTVGTALVTLYEGAKAREEAAAEAQRQQEAERARLAAEAEANQRAAALLAQQRADMEAQVQAQAASAAVMKRQMDQQAAGMQTIARIQGYATTAGSAYELESLRSATANIEADADQYGLAAPMVAMARDMAVTNLQSRIAAMVAAELPGLHEEALQENDRLAQHEYLASIATAVGYKEAPAPASTGTHYSTTTFKDNGDPILLNADGTRSIFCDVDEGDDPAPAAPLEPLRNAEGLIDWDIEIDPLAPGTAAAPEPAPAPASKSHFVKVVYTDGAAVDALRVAIRTLNNTRTLSEITELVADELAAIEQEENGDDGASE